MRWISLYKLSSVYINDGEIIGSLEELFQM